MICLIVDHHPVTSFGLAQLVRASFDGWQVETAATVAHAIERIDACRPDLVLLNLVLPDNTGLALLTHMHRQPQLQQPRQDSKPIASIVIAETTDHDTARLCERLGAQGFISRAHAFIALRQALMTVCAQQKYFEPAPVSEAARQPAPLRFTPRQRDILDLLLIGYSNKQIACALNLSCGTVKNYMFELM
ncbi:MAG: response regulator transcription factor, partial [Duganella sp.]